MTRRILTLLTVLVFVVLGAVSLAAQDQAAPAAPAQSSSEPMAKPMAKPMHHHAMAAAMQAETVAGQISIVDASKDLVVVTGANGVPYDFMVSKATKITVGGNKAKLDDLSGQTNKQASVTFMAEKRKGNIAKSIEVTQ